MKKISSPSLVSLTLLISLLFASCQKNQTIPTNQLGPQAYNLTRDLLNIGPRPPQSEGYQKASQLITQKLTAAGWNVQQDTHQISTPLGKKHFTNLRARFGKNPWNQTPAALLAAHLDSKLMPPQEQFLGADDSASACCAIVTIAQFLAKNSPQSAEKIELVFFDGEEALQENMTTLDGLYGSRAYTSKHWRDQPKKPQFGILLDMIGHKNLRIALPPDSPPHLLAQVQSSAQTLNASQHFTLANNPILDDHEPLNRAGIPTIDIIGDFSRFDWWHNHNGGKDNLSILSPDSLDISIRVTLHTLQALLKKP